MKPVTWIQTTKDAYFQAKEYTQVGGETGSSILQSPFPLFPP